jgi:DNA-binding NarL/FixJ family response regulator
MPNATTANAPQRTPVRTIIIDPYPLSRFGLTALIERHAGFEVVRTFASPRSLARAPKVDLVVLQTDGVTVDHGGLRTPIVEVRLSDTPQHILAAIRSRLEIRVRTTPRPDGPLSAREVEVIGLVAAGLTDYEIADALYLSVRTVRSHLDRIRAKTGMRRRADLTRWHLQERSKE